MPTLIIRMLPVPFKPRLQCLVDLLQRQALPWTFVNGQGDERRVWVVRFLPRRGVPKCTQAHWVVGSHAQNVSNLRSCGARAFPTEVGIRAHRRPSGWTRGRHLYAVVRAAGLMYRRSKYSCVSTSAGPGGTWRGRRRWLALWRFAVPSVEIEGHHMRDVLHAGRIEVCSQSIVRALLLWFFAMQRGLKTDAAAVHVVGGVVFKLSVVWVVRGGRSARCM